MKSTLFATILWACGSLFGQSAPNVVDLTNSPTDFVNKTYEITVTFNPMESSVSRMHNMGGKYYGGLLVSKIDGEEWESTHVNFIKSDSATIKKVNLLLKNQNFMEPILFRMRVKYLGKFGDFMGGSHEFELLELLE